MDIELAQALAENELLKSMLYCTKRSCNNCGKVNCENFQRQRIDCCGNWVSYKDYIKQLEEEKDKSWWEGFDTCKAKAGEANVKLSDEITLLKAQIEKMKWHKVSDGDLPKETGSYVVSRFANYLKRKKVSQTLFFIKGKGWQTKMDKTQIIAWCEIPQFN